MVEPTDVAAEPTRLETLVRNLKELRRSPDSGTITGQSESFGFAPPAATVRLWAGTSPDQDKTSRPAATLEVGKSSRGIRYVRPGGLDATEVVDAKLLSALDLPLTDWREPVVMSIPTFQVTSVKITQGGQAHPGRTGDGRPVAVDVAGNRSRQRRQDRKPARRLVLTPGCGWSQGVCRRQRARLRPLWP